MWMSVDGEVIPAFRLFDIQGVSRPLNNELFLHARIDNICL